MNSDKIIIGITHGDFNGIGYEVIIKALSDSKMFENFTPVIYGSAKALSFYKKGIEASSFACNVGNSIKEIHHKKVNLINCCTEDMKFEPGISSADAGRAAVIALEAAVADMKEGLIHAMVTAPINKDNVQSETFHFAGHTEFFEHRFGKADDALMLMVDGDLRVAVATGHIPLKEVSDNISVEKIKQKLKILGNSLVQDFRITKPRIAVLGLNPHSGDNGLLGNEEAAIIVPAINEMQAKGLCCYGPYAADGFFSSGKYQSFDAVLAMYHDQGLIPFKTLAMMSGVNYTAGLPIVRTSPDHGTAFDIAGKNAASEESMRHAVFLAYDITANRRQHSSITSNPLVSE